jgi:tRNA (cytidine32/uridine32-2'-O)-methyltransferase
MLDQVRIVLVETTHPGNIGAVARAMKTMGLTVLYLVRPKIFPSAECTARACGADDLLARAQVCGDLSEALRGCRLVIGSSARRRTVVWPELDPRQTAVRLLAEAARGPVALVFGRENSGLSNLELDGCHLLAHIPTDPQFSSLNLAAAVQLFAYELRMAGLVGGSAVSPVSALDARPLATADELDGMLVHLEQALGDLGFADPGRSRKLMRRLRRLFQRARPDRDEINILRGIFSSAQYLARRLRELGGMT